MRRPAFQFYGGDWMHDPGVRACSLAARGLWIDMISIMSQIEDPYGHLVFSAAKDTAKDAHKDILTPILPPVLARMVGASQMEVEQCLAELESFGVFSRTPEGVIFSRRMVRDEKVRESRAAGGFKSLENPNVPARKSASENGPRTRTRISFEGSLGGSPSSSSSSSSSSQNIPAKKKPSPESLTLYGMYPRKVGKLVALKAIEKALKLKPFEALLLAVQNFVRKCAREGTEERYIPHPATWFNEGRYDDEEFKPKHDALAGMKFFEPKGVQ
jgi:hypothetical protein